jgi:hypothetical protein
MYSVSHPKSLSLESLVKISSVSRLAVVLLFGSSVAAFAQTAAAPAPAPAAAPKPIPGSISSHAGWPAAKPEDVKSVDAILTALYDVISGPAGQPRDWNRFRSLFVPDAKLIPVRVLPGSPNPGQPATDAVFMSVDDYATRSSGSLTANGFYEHSINNDVQAFGNIVEVFSTYESRRKADDPKPFARGINSIQLLKDGERYWIVNVYWDSERPNNPIPAKYLPLKSQSR